jgi:hypothetical protein
MQKKENLHKKAEKYKIVGMYKIFGINKSKLCKVVYTTHTF